MRKAINTSNVRETVMYKDFPYSIKTVVVLMSKKKSVRHG